MLDLDEIFLFRLTHLDNMAHILQYGITHRNSENKNPNYVPIGDNTLIGKRNQKITKYGNLGDYIPFYFWFKMPMLYVIQKGHNGVPKIAPEKLVYCITTVKAMMDVEQAFIFSDGHSNSALSSLYSSDKIHQIKAYLDFTAIRETDWKKEPDAKRKKEAEFLVKGDISPKIIKNFLVYVQEGEQKLLSLGVAQEKIKVRPTYFFEL
jgi:hypothetical protein